MQNLLRNALNVGLLASFSLFTTQGVQAQTQKQKDRHAWLQPDIKYVEKRSWSLGVTYGAADLWADVGTKSPVWHYINTDYYKNMKGMGGVFIKYTHIPGLAARVGISNGTVYANDVWNKDVAFVAKARNDDAVERYYRNLDVKTNIWEGTFMIEISPRQLFSNWEFGKGAYARFQPYLMVGFGGMYFNPRGTLYTDFKKGTKQWVDLRPLRTEGQGFDKVGYPEMYSRYSMIVPAGVGFRFDLGPRTSIGLEYMLRYTFTDYLDDVSGKYVDPLRFDIAFLNEGYKADQAKQMQDRTPEFSPGTKNVPGTYRGDPSTMDLYSTVSVNFYWRLFKKSSPWWNRKF